MNFKIARGKDSGCSQMPERIEVPTTLTGSLTFYTYIEISCCAPQMCTIIVYHLKIKIK